MRLNTLRPAYAIPAIALLAAAVTAMAVVLWDTGSSATGEGVHGDADCDLDVDPNHARADLRYPPALGAAGPCTSRTGDADCDGRVGAPDAVLVLRHSG